MESTSSSRPNVGVPGTGRRAASRGTAWSASSGSRRPASSLRIAASMRWSASPGSMPSSSARTARASAYTSRASWLRCSTCRAVISWAHSRSRVGCSAVAARSSSTASAWRPSRSSCSKRSSSAPVLACPSRSTRLACERHVLDPRRGPVRATSPGPGPASRAASGGCSRAPVTSRSNSTASTSAASTSRRRPCGPSSRGPAPCFRPDPVDQRLQRRPRGHQPAPETGGDRLERDRVARGQRQQRDQGALPLAARGSGRRRRRRPRRDPAAEPARRSA